MEYQKIVFCQIIHQVNHLNLNWIEIRDESQVTYNKDNQITFKTSILRSSLCDYTDTYILVKGTTPVVNTAAQDAANNAANKK